MGSAATPFTGSGASGAPPEARPLAILVVRENEVDAEALAAFLATRTPAEATWTTPPLQEFHADIVLVSWQCCCRDGLLHRLSALAARVSFYGIEEKAAAVVACLESGVVACATASCAGDELVDVLRRVGRHGYALSDASARLLAQSFGERWIADRQPRLTARERETLALLAQGRCNKEIAAALSIRLPTVKNHLRSASEKLGVHSRTEAVALLGGSPLAELAPSTGKGVAPKHSTQVLVRRD